MRYLDRALTLTRAVHSIQQAADALVGECLTAGRTPPGFGHRFHARDPRAIRLFQLAMELELEGEHVHMLRAMERSLMAQEAQGGRHLPVNVDGAIAAISADIQWNRSRVEASAPDQTDTDKSMMFIAAKPDTATARIN